MENTLEKEKENEIIEKLVKINRCTKVVKGGRRFSFSALMAVGDKNGKVGIGFGKANEISEAIKKASTKAKRNMIKIPLKGNSLMYPIQEKFCKSVVWIKPATKGTGLIAGGSVRVLLELAGVHDVLSKIRGNRNSINVIKAAFKCLQSIKNPGIEARKRGKTLHELYNIKNTIVENKNAEEVNYE